MLRSPFVTVCRRLLFKVRIATKPIKQGEEGWACAWGAVTSWLTSCILVWLAGFKVYAICCGRSSYTLLVVPMAWTGRDERSPEFVAAHPGSGGLIDLVTHMTSVLADRAKHILVADNWFTCVPVLDQCTAWGMGFLGAMKHFRGSKAVMLWPVRLGVHHVVSLLLVVAWRLYVGLFDMVWLCRKPRAVFHLGLPASCTMPTPSAAYSSGWTRRQR